MQRIAACLLIISLNAYGGEDSHPEMLRGYTAQNSATEVQWEQKLRAVPETDRLRENMRRLSARPHHVGSPYDKDNAEWLLAQLKSYGLDAQNCRFLHSAHRCARRAPVEMTD